MQHIQRIACTLTTSLASALAIGQLQATTTPDPGDYNPAPDGTHLALVYLQRQYADDTYAQGHKAIKGIGLGLDIMILRSVNFFKIGDLPADWQIILPMAREHIDISDTKLTGVGDAIVGGTVWSLSHPDKAEYLGWSAFLTIPSGARSAQGLVVSNDRYALDLQSGYTRSLGGKWSMDLLAQAELYTKSGNTHISTDPLYRLFASLRYAISKRTYLEFVARQSWGAHQDQFGDVLQHANNNTNLLIGINTSITRRFQLQLQLADDVYVTNGPRLRSIQTRFAYAF